MLKTKPVVIILIVLLGVAAGVLVFLAARKAFLEDTIWGQHRIYKRLDQLRIAVLASQPNKEAFDQLVTALTTGQTSFERTQAANQLARLGEKAAPALNSLLTTLQGNDLFAAPQAARAIGNIGPKASRAVPVLIRTMNEYPTSDRGVLSAEAIGKVADVNDAYALQALTIAESSPYKDMSEAAKFGLDGLKNRARIGFGE